MYFVCNKTFQDTYNEKEVRDVIKVLVDVVGYLHARGIVSTTSQKPDNAGERVGAYDLFLCRTPETSHW